MTVFVTCDPGPHRHRLLVGLSACATLAIVTATVLLVAAGWMCKALPGDWSTPVRLGPPAAGVAFDAGVSSLIDVSTGRLAMRLLDGRSITSRAGVLHVTRIDDDRFAIDCAPCGLRFAALGNEAVEVPSIRIVASRRADVLAGTIEAGDGGDGTPRIAGRFKGRFDRRGMRIDVAFDRAPIATWYRVFAARIPELRRADIHGVAAIAVRVELPSWRIAVEPSIEGFAVDGLGTERLKGRLPEVACGAAADSATPTLPASATSDFGRWLPLAVVAAEDQHYAEHPGYDLGEVLASLSRNQLAAGVERGGSTIPQQLAKLLYVGGDRTVDRKMRELLYAVEMERTLGKARMLQLYLAVAPWGEGSCGAESAALHYFGRPAARLTPAQAVWLAAMLHGPDREAARWRAAGQVDQARALWVAHGIRHLRAGTRRHLDDAIATLGPRTDATTRSREELAALPVLTPVPVAVVSRRSAGRLPPAAGS